MAVYDREAGRLVVRIVYDGPPHAGKTTNLRELCRFFSTERRSELFTPAEDKGRTLYFDWLQIECGFVAGRPLRCQLVSVPGQQEYALRRSALLREADAVVFVCESTLDEVQRARHGFELLRGYLAGHGRADAPVIVQANKQDLDGAQSPDDVARVLGGSRGIAASAAHGVGVRETVVLAVRAIAEKLQAALLAHGTDAMSGAPTTAEGLLREIRGVEASEPRATARVAIPQPASVERVVAPVAVPKPPTRRGRAAARGVLLPDGDAPIGCVWPATTGRAALTALDRAHAERRDDLVMSFVPGGEAARRPVIYDVGTSRARTAPWLRFATLDSGREALRRLVHRRQLLGELLDPDAVLALQHDAADKGAWWLWEVAPRRTTLQAAMVRAKGRRNEDALGQALVRFADAAVRTAALGAWHGMELDLHPSNFALREEDPALSDETAVAYLDECIEEQPQDTDLAPALLQRADEYASFATAIDAFVQAATRALRRAAGQGIDLAPFAASLARAPAHTPTARNARERLRELLAVKTSSLWSQNP